MSNGTGFIKDVPDSRDFKTRELFGAPEPFDWAVGFDIEQDLGITLPVNDQGSSQSCVGQSKSKDREIKECLETGAYNSCSARSIYALRPNKPGEGMQFRDACEIEKNQGVALRKDVPDFKNEQDMNAVPPTGVATTKTESYLVFQFWNDIDALATHIRDYHGAMIGFDGLNNGTFYNEHPTFPTDPSQVRWGHAVFAGKAKMVNGEKRVYFLNSWGIGCGVNGWQYITENDLKINPGGYNAFYQGRVTTDLSNHDFMADQFLKDNEGKLIQMTGAGATGEFGTVVNGVLRTGDAELVLATYLARKEGKGIPKELWADLPKKPVNQN